MSSAGRKTPSSARSGSSRSKRKLARSTSTTKALVNKVEHVKKQALKTAPPVRAAGKVSGTRKKPSINGTGNTPEVLRTAATENSPPALGPMQILAFWSPMAVLLRQQTILASMVENIMQSQRHWTQAFSRSV
jgi:hypothetical protein